MAALAVIAAVAFAGMLTASVLLAADRPRRFLPARPTRPGGRHRVRPYRRGLATPARHTTGLLR